MVALRDLSFSLSLLTTCLLAFVAAEPCEWPPLPLAHDNHGKRCTTCNPPPPDRLVRHDYQIRQDCGRLVNDTDWLPGALDIPLVQLNRPATATQPFTIAMCELNDQKTCIDAIENKDYMYYAKGINLDVDVPDCIKHWDGQYCLLNGFLRPEFVRKAHDFDAMAASARALCAARYADAFNISAITLRDEQRAYSESIAGGDVPSREAAEFVAAWNCAMGDLACDMTYCAYTFCDLGNGSTGIYGECDGWDKVQGMPIPASPGCDLSFLQVELDANRKRCNGCDPPLPQRLSRHDYRVRQDCGGLVNGSEWLPGAVDTPMVQLNRPATAEQPFMNAMCELNVQKNCVDAIVNEDYMYYAKGTNVAGVPDLVTHYDGQYCQLNGFLRPENVRKAHDFQAMGATAQELCAGKYADKFNISAITYRDAICAYHESITGSDSPTVDFAEYLAAWNCAMGDLACDMTYCAYTYCDFGNGSTGFYDECDGWDEVHGMPTPGEPHRYAIWIVVGLAVLIVIVLIIVVARKYFVCSRDRTENLEVSLAGAPIARG